MAITAHYMMVDQVKTFYETNNSDRSETIVCLHSEGRETRQFHGLMKALAGKFRVIAFDMPGHGKTWPLRGNVPITGRAQYLEFIWSAIQALGVEKPILLGCGLGANCALALAQTHEAAGVISISGAAETLAEVSSGLLMHPQVSLPFAVQEYNKSVIGRDAGDEARELICWQAWCETAISYQADIELLTSFDIREKMDAIRCPVLLIQGADDWTISQQMFRETAESLSGAAEVRCVLLDGVGRFAMVEQPARVAEAVCGFLHS